jgi:hypothetical protein
MPTTNPDAWKEISKKAFEMDDEDISNLDEALKADLPRKELEKFVLAVDYWVATERCANFTEADSTKALERVEEFLQSNTIIFAITHLRACKKEMRRQARESRNK